MYNVALNKDWVGIIIKRNRQVEEENFTVRCVKEDRRIL